MKGKFITFEGTEGSGKTTIIERLIEHLEDLGYKVKKTREPGGSKISEEIRNIILDIDNTKMDSRCEALLYAASRRQHLIEVVLPYLEEGYIVICDRYIDSSLSYQGYARGLGIEEVYSINQFATNGLLPDLTVFIDVRPSVGLMRIKNNHRIEDRLDLEEMSFHENVYKGYKEVEKKFPNRFISIDGEQEKDKVYQDVKEVVINYLNK